MPCSWVAFHLAAHVQAEKQRVHTSRVTTSLSGMRSATSPAQAGSEWAVFCDSGNLPPSHGPGIQCSERTTAHLALDPFSPQKYRLCCLDRKLRLAGDRYSVRLRPGPPGMTSNMRPYRRFQPLRYTEISDVLAPAIKSGIVASQSGDLTCSRKGCGLPTRRASFQKARPVQLNVQLYGAHARQSAAGFSGLW